MERKAGRAYRSVLDLVVATCTAALVGAMSVVPPDPRRVAGVAPSAYLPVSARICPYQSDCISPYLLASPRISSHLPVSAHICPYLPVSPRISYLLVSPGISRYLPVSRHIPPYPAISRHIPPYPAADTAKKIVHTRDPARDKGTPPGRAEAAATPPWTASHRADMYLFARIVKSIYSAIFFQF